MAAMATSKNFIANNILKPSEIDLKIEKVRK
jgi:hypothetical protein